MSLGFNSFFSGQNDVWTTLTRNPVLFWEPTGIIISGDPAKVTTVSKYSRLSCSLTRICFPSAIFYNPIPQPRYA